MVEPFRRHGWVRFPAEPAVADWAAHARRAGQAAVSDPAYAQWHQCEGTWFVGVDALDNDANGRVGASAPLTGAAPEFIAAHFGPVPPLHRAQLSVIYPGYPRPRAGESEAAFRYRLKRDAAHVDGVKLFGSDRRRRVEEPHAWVLGLPLTDTSEDAAPLVVWEGSHAIMRAAFLEAFSGVDPKDWSVADVTDIYQAARARVFDTCARIIVHARPGEAYVLHPLVLHGVAPWAADATAPADGRMIAYFRPDVAGGLENWLQPI